MAHPVLVKTKECPRCETEKAINEFGRDAARPDGRYICCKACRKNPSKAEREVEELAAKGLKKCTLCLKVKPFEAFNVDNTKRLGRTSRCRKCHKDARESRGEPLRVSRLDRRKAYSRQKVERDYTRWEVFEDDNFTCYLCEDVLDPLTACPDPASATIDHVVPLSRGGCDTRENVRTACLACNCAKGDMPLEDYLLRKSLV